ncbi:ATP-dependent Clp protease ATP-binding subunit ClpX [Mytilus galloprovincialis]|uniref:ATP-dependent Clp protease ATP-binding subunit ClpX n=1 Tax=Mytilus galloprovincialis TaxID=29158 RepID=A0A8B6HJQ8_MYTGA|nr:ATP-dependent Clp protease ATP-binding subunit ClpX [Mytilus galloprovincialis]
MSASIRLCSSPVRHMVASTFRRNIVCVQRVSDVRIFKVWQQISAAPGSYRFMCTGKDGGGGEEGGGGGKNFKPPGDIKSFKCHKCGHENKYDLAGKEKKFSVLVCQNEDCKASIIVEPISSPEPPKPPKPEITVNYKPEDIHKFLDQHVIGQQKCKKYLATQVYQHARKIQKIMSEQQQKTAQVETDVKMKDFELQFRAFLGNSGKVVPFQTQYQEALQTSPLGLGTTPQQQQPYPKIDIIETNKEVETFIRKSNMFLIGPTGTGKTLQVETLAKCLNLPFAKWDCTNLTSAGYVGEDVESVIELLYHNAGQDVQKCQTGIVYLDEVDKLRKTAGLNVRDVGGEGVQQSLLKILEGSVVNIPQDRGSNKRLKDKETVQIDTTNILFILSGAFTGIEDIVRRRVTKDTSFGLGAAKVQSETELQAQKNKAILSKAEVEFQERNSLREKLEEKDIIDYGFLPEFVGRVAIIATVQDLSVDDLIRILTEPKSSIVSQYKQMFALDDCDLEIEPGGLKAIAEKAFDKKVGARGLRSIMESLFLDIMYHLPDLKSVIITEDFVRGKAEAIIVKKPEEVVEVYG